MESFQRWEENGSVQGEKAGEQVRRLWEQSSLDKVVACTRAEMMKNRGTGTYFKTGTSRICSWVGCVVQTVAVKYAAKF